MKMNSIPQVKSIKFKNPILDVLANKRSVVVAFSERFAVFDAGTLEDRMAVTTCFPCPCPLGGSLPINPLALGDRWLAYADKKLNQSKRSSGGCEGEGVTSYTATVLHAAKSLSKGLRGLGETVAHSLAGGRSTSQSPSPPNADIQQPGVITILDIEGIEEDDCQDTEEPFDPIVAHFVAHSEAIIALKFDASGMLLVTADRRGHDFHVFRINPHPCGPSLASVHHLYILHRGDTTAKVQDIAISADARWTAISTLRGTTHVFAISAYGGACGVRTHTQPRVVNRLSRFHRSAGLPIHAPHARRRPQPQGSPASVDGLAQGAWFPNPRLPPYPLPTTVSPLAQIRPTANLPTHTITRNSSGRQRLSSVSEDTSSAPLLARARFGTAMGGGRAPAPLPALYLVPASGDLLHLLLHPKPLASVPKEKICDDSPIELDVEAIAQWPLQRPPAAADLLAPLPPSNPLLQPLSCRRCADMCMSEEERWLSQVEIVTHAGPHRRLWMGPQFVFKTYNCTGSNSSLSEAETVEVDTSVSRGVARSNPVNMPGVRPVVPVLIDSGSASSLEHSPSDSCRRKSLLAESGRVPSVCDVQLREDLAEAMKEDQGWRERSRERGPSVGVGVGASWTVDPLGTVAQPGAAPPPPPLDADAYTTSNCDEATFRPVVRAPALPYQPHMPVRPLPRTTTIPAQNVHPLPAPTAPAAPPSPPAPLPLTTAVVIPAALHPAESLPSSNPPPPDIQPAARPRVKKSPPTETSRLSDASCKDRKSSKIKEARVASFDSKAVVAPSASVIELSKVVEAPKVNAPEVVKSSKVVEPAFVVKTPKEEGPQKDIKAPKVMELPKVVKAPKEVEQKVVKTLKDVEQSKVKAPKEIEQPQFYKAPKKIEQSEVVKAPKEIELPKVVKATKEIDQSKFAKIPKENEAPKIVKAATEVEPMVVPKEIDIPKVVKAPKEIEQTKAAKTLKEESPKVKVPNEEPPKVKTPKVTELKHDIEGPKADKDIVINQIKIREPLPREDLDFEELKEIPVLEEPKYSKAPVLKEPKASKIEKSSKKEQDSKESVLVVEDTPQDAVTLTLSSKKDLSSEWKSKNFPAPEVKTEEHAWDMLFSEPDRPILNVSHQLTIAEDSKPKSKKNRKSKKTQEEIQTKADEDSFVEIHAIEEKQQPSSGELVSISSPYENIEPCSYASKMKKTRSVKSMTPERVDEFEANANVWTRRDFDSSSTKSKNSKRNDNVLSDIEVSPDPYQVTSKEVKKEKVTDTLKVECTDYTSSESTSPVIKESPKSRKSKSPSPYSERRKSTDKVFESDVKDVYVINTTTDDFPEIQITRGTKSRKKSPQPAERKSLEKEVVTEKPVKSWSSIAASKTVKRVEERDVDKKNLITEMKSDKTRKDESRFDAKSSFKEVSLQEKLFELCKRTDIMVAECDAPSELTFIEEHHSVLHDLPPLEPLDFGLDDFNLEVMRDSLLEVNEPKISSPICKINIDDILTSIKETTSKVIESSTFNLIDLERVPTRKERGFSVVETDKITSQEVKIDDDKSEGKEEVMEKSSDDDITSPVVSTDSDKEDKKSAGASNVTMPSTKQSTKSKKSRRKKK